MTAYEYKVVPAPRQAKRFKGAKTPAERFARTLAEVLNDEGRSGWEFLRAETLPSEEKKGMLSGSNEVYQTMLCFRRPLRVVEEEDWDEPPKRRLGPMSLGPANRR